MNRTVAELSLWTFDDRHFRDLMSTCYVGIRMEMILFSNFSISKKKKKEGKRVYNDDLKRYDMQIQVYIVGKKKQTNKTVNVVFIQILFLNCEL